VKGLTAVAAVLAVAGCSTIPGNAVDKPATDTRKKI